MTDRPDRPIPTAGRAVPFGDDRGDVPGWVLITLMTAGLATTSRKEGDRSRHPRTRVTQTVHALFNCSRHPA
jgi:hypothetical protein